MKRQKRKKQPYNPATDSAPAVHDRRATELGKDDQVYFVEVDDPYEAGAKILAARSRRDDPLAGMHSRKTIDTAQYEAGRSFQRDFEAVERGPRAIDPGKEYVDGGLAPELISETQRKAALRLKRVYKELGPGGSALIHDVLVHGLAYRKVAEKRGFSGERWEKFFGMSVHLHLHTLSFVYGFASEKTGKKRVVDETCG
jgi:hypothetical protein